MFRIGIFELAITCGLILFLAIVPVIVAWYYSRVDRRLKNIEKQLEKNKDQ